MDVSVEGRCLFKYMEYVSLGGWFLVVCTDGFVGR